MKDSKVVGGPPALLSNDEFASLREVGKGADQGDIPQVHWERLVALGLCTQKAWVPAADRIRKATHRSGKRSARQQDSWLRQHNVLTENNQGDFEKDLIDEKTRSLN